jgi:MoaA/NifB/PqqE/SkfB family radical SAM enzyme
MLNSDLAHQIRQSIRDGTYDFCDDTKCGIIVNNRLVKLAEIDQLDSVNGLPSTYERVTNSDIVDLPRYVYIDGDLTCNLSCPSCRTHIITQSDEEKKGHTDIVKMLNAQLFNSSDNRSCTVYVAAAGELFASPVMLDFLETFPLDRYPNVEFNFQSNGLLLKKRWHRVRHLENNIFAISITADSQDPETYAKLRRGGQLNDLIKNLEFVKELKTRLHFNYSIRMVVQQDNISEIEKFTEFALSYGADTVEFLRLSDRGSYTKEETARLDVLSPRHTMYEESMQRFKSLKEAYTDKIAFYHFNI